MKEWFNAWKPLLWFVANVLMIAITTMVWWQIARYNEALRNQNYLLQRTILCLADQTEEE